MDRCRLEGQLVAVSSVPPELASVIGPRNLELPDVGDADSASGDDRAPAAPAYAGHWSSTGRATGVDVPAQPAAHNAKAARASLVISEYYEGRPPKDAHMHPET